MDNEKVARITDRGMKFKSLSEHVGWHELAAMHQAREKKYTEALANRLLSGAPVDQREIDRHAGFFAGCRWLLACVNNAEDTLENALRQAGAMKE